MSADYSIIKQVSCMVLLYFSCRSKMCLSVGNSSIGHGIGYI